MAREAARKLLLVCVVSYMNLVAGNTSCDLDPEQRTWCVPSDFAAPEDIGKAMDFICGALKDTKSGPQCADCPDSNEWAFNAYFQQKWKVDGSKACDFEGVGQLVWSSSSPLPCRPNGFSSSKQWCLPKPNTPNDILQSSLDFACGQVDCSTVAQGKGCVFPTGLELQYTADYAYNQYYQKFGSCDFRGSGTMMNADCSPLADEKTSCSVKSDAPAAKVFASLIWIRQSSPSIRHKLYDRCPVPSHQKDSWMYNEGFKLNYEKAGNRACDYSGTGQLSWPEKSPCRPMVTDSQLIHGKIEKKWCLPKAGVSTNALVDGIKFVCGQLDCSLIGEGGACVFPAETELQDKAEWAFNTFYQRNYLSQGKAACNFLGKGQLYNIDDGLPPRKPVPTNKLCNLDPLSSTWCTVSPWANHAEVEKALKLICESGTVECNQCPDSADWKYNEYFQKHWVKDGAKACDFGGSGKLSWAPDSHCRPSQKDSTWCLPKADTWPEKRDDLQANYDKICQTDVDCSMLEEGSSCVFPPGMEILYKAEWAYHASYKKNGKCDGEYMDSDCTPSEDQKTQCSVSDNAPAARVFPAVIWICTTYKVLCDRCPLQTRAKDSWIYNEYFKKNYHEAGNQACDFKGTGQFNWPGNSPCRPSKSDMNWCVAKRGASAKDLGDAIGFVCHHGVDCSVIANTSECQYPILNEAHYKADWAFNTFFQLEYKKAGNEACDFGGLATITWPEDTICRPRKSDEKWCLPKPFLYSQTAVLLKDIQFICAQIDCSDISDRDKCLFPVGEEIRYKADWAFNQYYQKHKLDGKWGCDFQGHGQLVDPSELTERGQSRKSSDMLHIVI